MKPIANKINYRKYLTNNPLYPYLEEWELIDQFKHVYLKPGQKCQLACTSIVFNLAGLLKQYHRKSPSGSNPRFIQFILPETIWVYEDYPLNPIFKALKPSLILYFPIRILEHYISKSKSFQIIYQDAVDLGYWSGFLFSGFIKELKSPEERLNILLEIYGQNLLYLSSREISYYAGVNETQVNYFIHRILK